MVADRTEKVFKMSYDDNGHRRFLVGSSIAGAGAASFSLLDHQKA
jgi:hypothetical protein